MTTFNRASMVVLTTRFQASEDNHVGNFKKAFSEICNLENDIKIVAAGGEHLETNRFILSVFSPTLQTLLTENGGLSTAVYLPDCSYKSLKHLLSLFTRGISQVNFSGLSDINDLIDTAKLLSVDLKNLSFVNQSSFGSKDHRDNSQNETIVTEGFLGRNNEIEELGVENQSSEGKRRVRLSFEKNPSNFKKPKIEDNSRLALTAILRNEKFKEPTCEDSGFKSIPDISEYKSEHTNSIIQEKFEQTNSLIQEKSYQTYSLHNEENLICSVPQSPKINAPDRRISICSKKDGKNRDSFCKIHMKVHSVKKVLSQIKRDEPKLNEKVRRKLLNTKDSKFDWNCDVCNISFNTRVKLRDHRREIKCKRRIVCKNKQRSVDFPILEEKSILPMMEEQSLYSVQENRIPLPFLEENYNSSNESILNDSITLEENSNSSNDSNLSSPSNLDLFEDISQETYQAGEHIDKSSLFSSLMQNSLVSSNEKEETQSGKNFVNSSLNPRKPRRLSLSELVSSGLPSTPKDMSSFEAKFNTSPIRKKLMLKCCPKNSTLKKCCLKLDRSPDRKSKETSPNKVKESKESFAMMEDNLIAHGNATVASVKSGNPAIKEENNYYDVHTINVKELKMLENS